MDASVFVAICATVIAVVSLAVSVYEARPDVRPAQTTTPTARSAASASDASARDVAASRRALARRTGHAHDVHDLHVADGRVVGPAGWHDRQHRGAWRPGLAADAGHVDPECDLDHGPGRYGVHPDAAEDGGQRPHPGGEE